MLEQKEGKALYRCWKTLAKATCGDGTSKDGLFLPAGAAKCTHGSWCFYGVVVDGVVLSVAGNDGENYGNILLERTMLDVRKSKGKFFFASLSSRGWFCGVLCMF